MTLPTSNRRSPAPGVRVLQQVRTSLAPAQVLGEAKRFFVRRNSMYPVFLEKEGPRFATFRGQGGEEVVIGVSAELGGTVVTGSTYMFDQQIARFFASLPPAAANGTDTPGAPRGAVV